MANTTRTQPGFMSLPRETRDEIYAHLLTSTYGVDTSPSLKTSNLSDGAQDGSSTGLGFDQKIALSPPFTSQLPSDRMAILQVNRTIAAEAKEVLYRLGTFVFNINFTSVELSAIELDNIKAKDMRNIEVNVDFWQSCGQISELLSLFKLLAYFVSNLTIPNQCVINIRNIRDFNALAKGLPHIVGQLTTFQTVELNIQDRDPREPWAVTPGLGDELKRLRLETYKRLSPILSIELGPCTSGYEKDRVYRMRFYPQNICRSKAIADKDDISGGNLVYRGRPSASPSN